MGISTLGLGDILGTSVTTAVVNARQQKPHSVLVHWKYDSLLISDKRRLLLMRALLLQCGQTCCLAMLLAPDQLRFNDALGVLHGRDAHGEGVLRMLQLARLDTINQRSQ